MVPCYINLLFLYRFEVIFNWHFNATYTFDTEQVWCHVLELQANFEVSTYKVVGGTLTSMDKEHVGSHPKMFLFALDKLSYIYQCINNTDARCIIAYEMLSFASNAWNGMTGDRSQSVIHLDLPCPTSTWGMLEALRGSPGPFTTGCMSQKVSWHFQACMTGPASSTR